MDGGVYVTAPALSPVYLQLLCCSYCSTLRAHPTQKHPQEQMRRDHRIIQHRTENTCTDAHHQRNSPTSTCTQNQSTHTNETWCVGVTW